MKYYILVLSKVWYLLYFPSFHFSTHLQIFWFHFLLLPGGRKKCSYTQAWVSVDFGIKCMLSIHYGSNFGDEKKENWICVGIFQSQLTLKLNHFESPHVLSAPSIWYFKARNARPEFDLQIATTTTIHIPPNNNNNRRQKQPLNSSGISIQR